MASRQRTKRPAHGWYEAAARWDWLGRAAASDRRQRAKKQEEHEEVVRKIQEKHQLQLKAISNKLIQIQQGVDWGDLSIVQLFRFTKEIILMERLVLGEPISVQRHHHVGGDDGAIRSESTTFVGSFQPSPQQMAEVMRILADHGGLEDPAPEAASPFTA